MYTAILGRKRKKQFFFQVRWSIGRR